MWRLDEYTRILAQRIELEGVPEVYDRAALIHQALVRLKTATPPPSAPVNSFREALATLAADRAAEPTKRFRVVLPLYLSDLTAKHAISALLVQKLATWRHPGFSAHVGEPISFEDEQALEDVANYVVWNVDRAAPGAARGVTRRSTKSCRPSPRAGRW
jgi:hypothetical protein